MANTQNQPIKVFLSYSRADSERIDRLEAELIGYGFRTWVDRDQLEGGQRWADQIERAIQGCNVLVVGLSPEAANSPWVKDELAYAGQFGKPIIPVLLRAVDVIPLLLVAIQYVDLSRDERQGIQQLRMRLLQVGSKELATQPSVRTSSPVTRRIAPTPQERVDDPTTTLVLLPPLPPAPDLNDLFTQGIAAWAHGDLDLAEATLRQVVERNPQFKNGVAAQQLAEAQRQLLPIQIDRLRIHAHNAEVRGAWGEAINAWQSLLELAPSNSEAQESLWIDQQNQGAVWVYNNARKLAASNDLPAFCQMWQLLKQQAPHYSDPADLQKLLPVGTLLSTIQHPSDIDRIPQRMPQWAPDGRHIATFSQGDWALFVWQVTSGRLLFTFPISGLPSVVWSPDSQCIAMTNPVPLNPKLPYGSTSWQTQVLEVISGRLLATCQDRLGGWSPDGERIATTYHSPSDLSLERTQVWEARSGRLLAACRGRFAAWAPDGQRIATADYSMVWIWDATTGDLLHTCQGRKSDITLFPQDEDRPDLAVSVTWSLDGQRIATTGDETQVWEANTGKLLSACVGYTVAWSPDSQFIATGSYDSSRGTKTQVWDAKSGRMRATCQGYQGTWAPNSQRIVTTSGHLPIPLSSVGTPQDGYDRELERALRYPIPGIRQVWVWETKSGRLLATCQGHLGGWSPDSQRLATGNYDENTVRIWEATSGRLLVTCHVSGGGLASLAWAPDGQRVATGTTDGGTLVWETNSGRLLATCRGYLIGWAPDSQRLVTVAQDGTTLVWKASSHAHLTSGE